MKIGFLRDRSCICRRDSQNFHAINTDWTQEEDRTATVKLHDSGIEITGTGGMGGFGGFGGNKGDFGGEMPRMPEGERPKFPKGEMPQMPEGGFLRPSDGEVSTEQQTENRD